MSFTWPSNGIMVPIKKTYNITDTVLSESSTINQPLIEEESLINLLDGKELWIKPPNRTCFNFSEVYVVNNITFNAFLEKETYSIDRFPNDPCNWTNCSYKLAYTYEVSSLYNLNTTFTVLPDQLELKLFNHYYFNRVSYPMKIEIKEQKTSEIRTFAF